MVRRLLLFAAVVAGVGSALAAPPDPGEEERRRWLREGEGALASGETMRALHAFDRAASIAHAADAEMGLVRAYLQEGEYRRALAMVAHAAEAHRDVPAATALHVWLLHLGGHPEHAARILADARTRIGADATLDAVYGQLHSRRPLARGVLLESPGRLAPHARVSLPRGARIAGAATLLPGGRSAVVPMATLRGREHVWLRNGLGDTVSARLGRADPRAGIALLVLDRPLAERGHMAIAPRDAFPGSIVYAGQQFAAFDAEPAWPMLRAGFLGTPAGAGEAPRAGVDIAAGPGGGPLLDSAGRLVGIALPDGRIAPASALRRLLRPAAEVDPAASNTRMSIDQVYETALRATLQVIASPRTGHRLASRPG